MKVQFFTSRYYGKVTHVQYSIIVTLCWFKEGCKENLHSFCLPEITSRSSDAYTRLCKPKHGVCSLFSPFKTKADLKIVDLIDSYRSSGIRDLTNSITALSGRVLEARSLNNMNVLRRTSSVSRILC